MFAFTSYQLPQAIVQQGRDVQRIPFASVSTQPVHEGVFDYAGVDDHYFLGALLPPDGVNTRVQYAPVHINTPHGPRELVDYRVRVGGEPRTLDFFYGPKDFDILATVDRELVRAIHFGWFAFLAVPLLRALKWVNAFVGNYGWSIIILTVLINLADVPLAPQERRLDAQDAGYPAAGESDPGSLRQAESDRSGAAEDEHRAHESVS